jgi:ATP-dependent DNA helicase RecG
MLNPQMNPSELKDLATQGESDRLEFKRSTGQRTEAAKTVCAMLNGIGGFVLFGVGDTGELLGQQIGTKTLEDITTELRRIEPPAFPEVQTVPLKEGLGIIALTVVGSGGPYTFDGRPYLRHGSTTVIMPREAYERRLVERLHATRRWENEPVADGVAIQDLDEEEIRTTLDNAVQLGRVESPTRRGIESILQGLELLHEGRLLNAAVALYGKSSRLQVHYPQLEIRVARFRGTDRLADFTDNRQYWGHAFSLLRRAESFLLDHVPIAGRIVSGRMIRQDSPLYPPRATREALANAICHRDYTVPGGALAVAMYDDHLEITNPGSLHFGITPEKLTLPHESRPWNPIVANVLYRAGVIERWGMGTLNILDWCRDNGNPPPAWAEHAGSVYVTFAPAVPEAPRLEKDRDGEQARDQVGTKLGLSWEQVGTLRNCQEAIALVDLIAGAGRSNRTKFRDQVLRPLVDKGLIELTVPDKPRSRNQRYRMTARGREALADIESTGSDTDKEG